MIFLCKEVAGWLIRFCSFRNCIFVYLRCMKLYRVTTRLTASAHLVMNIEMIEKDSCIQTAQKQQSSLCVLMKKTTCFFLKTHLGGEFKVESCAFPRLCSGPFPSSRLATLSGKLEPSLQFVLSLR
mmetsp:Transcript_14706/g.20085  ORF Transcript_14706/g.20085 Transcript_14706/m.20085 type:complete len:126 (-) Transcript_14706:286-663(-)